MSIRVERSYRDRWPTVRGENPPAGIPFRKLRLWLGRYAVEVRLWKWR